MSIRNPTANNSVVGLAPTRGLIPRAGQIMTSFTQERAGPMARSVYDVAALTDVVAGFDAEDLLTIVAPGNMPTASYTTFLDKKRLARRAHRRVPRSVPQGPKHAEGIALVEKAIAQMKEAGAVIVDPVSTGIDLFPLLEDTRTNYYEAQFSYDLYFRRLGPDAVIHDMDELIAKGGELVKPSIVQGYREFNSLMHHPDFLARRDTQETLKAAVIELMDKYRLDVLVHPFKSLPPRTASRRERRGEGQSAELRHRPAGGARAGRLHARRERSDRDRVPRPAVQRADAVQARVRVRAGLEEPQDPADDAAAARGALRVLSPGCRACAGVPRSPRRCSAPRPRSGLTIVRSRHGAARARARHGDDRGPASCDGRRRADGRAARAALPESHRRLRPEGPALNSLIAVNAEALAMARELDRERATTGPRSPLHGIPIVAKDLVNTAGMQTTGGFIAMKGAVPAHDAHVISELRAAGAIVLAKTNMSDWLGRSRAGGGSSIAGQVVNPYDLTRTVAAVEQRRRRLDGRVVRRGRHRQRNRHFDPQPDDGRLARGPRADGRSDRPQRRDGEHLHARAARADGAQYLRPRGHARSHDRHRRRRPRHGAIADAPADGVVHDVPESRGPARRAHRGLARNVPQRAAARRRPGARRARDPRSAHGRRARARPRRARHRS